MSFREKAEQAAAKAVERDRLLAEAQKQFDVSGEEKGIEESEWAPLAGQLADWATTREALKRGGREANPVMVKVVQNAAAFLAVKVGMGVLGGRIVDRFNDHAGKLERIGAYADAESARRKARWASLGLTLLGLGPAINNALVARKR